MRKMFINLCEPISAVEKSPYSGMQFIILNGFMFSSHNHWVSWPRMAEWQDQGCLDNSVSCPSLVSSCPASSHWRFLANSQHGNLGKSVRACHPISQVKEPWAIQDTWELRACLTTSCIRMCNKEMCFSVGRTRSGTIITGFKKVGCLAKCFPKQFLL